MSDAEDIGRQTDRRELIDSLIKKFLVELQLIGAGAWRRATVANAAVAHPTVAVIAQFCRFIILPLPFNACWQLLRRHLGES